MAEKSQEISKTNEDLLAWFQHWSKAQEAQKEPERHPRAIEIQQINVKKDPLHFWVDPVKSMKELRHAIMVEMGEEIIPTHGKGYTPVAYANYRKHFGRIV